VAVEPERGERDPDDDQVAVVDLDRRGRRAVVDQEVRRERDQAHEQQHDEVQPQQAPVDPLAAAEHAVVGHPVVADDDEADAERRQVRGEVQHRLRHLPAGGMVAELRDGDAEDEQRHRDREHAVAQREQAAEAVAAVVVLGLAGGLWLLGSLVVLGHRPT
jgi:hypothetical protein